MADVTDDNRRTMRDAFRVWNVDAVERELVLRSSDDQYVAVPLPAENQNLFERLEDSEKTVKATLAETGIDGPSWRIAEIHGVNEDG